MISSYISDNYFTYMKPTRHLLPLQDPFGKLSDEILLQILKWLPKKTLLRCALVNKRFSRITTDDSLWSRLDLGCKVLRNGALAVIISRGVVILRLAQTAIYDPVFNALDAGSIAGDGDFNSVQICKLQYLDLSMARISVTGLADLLRRCRHLKKLSLEHVPLNDAVCEQIAQNVDMEALNLALCEGISGNAVRTMFGNLQKLQTLNMAWTTLSKDALVSFCDTVTPSVVRLNISGCRITMTDETLQILTTRLFDLRELDLSDCNQLTSNAIRSLKLLEHLEYLSLSRCYNLFNKSYLDLREIKTLKYLDVFGTLSDQALDTLVRSFHPVGINKFVHSAVARPTVGTRRTSIWGIRTRN